ncbi:hypothetical protein ACUIAJ_03910 [Dermabacteraceae bacterium CCM 9519]
MAASRVAVQIEGHNKAIKELEQAVGSLEDLKKVHRESAGIVLDRALQRVPVGKENGGRLKRTLRTGATKRTGVIRAGRAAVPYAMPIHWGWHRRKIRPTFFLTEAAKDTETRWVALYDKALEDALK